MTAIDLDAIRPASDELVEHLRETLGERMAHEHPAEGKGPDLFCLNLTSYMGERMGPVLRRLADEQAEVRRLRAELAWLTDGPGPDVTEVYDSDGDRWIRDGDEWRHELWRLNSHGMSTPWYVLAGKWGPITLAAPGGSEAR